MKQSRTNMELVMMHRKNLALWHRQNQINETHQFLITALFVIIVAQAIVVFALYNHNRSRISELEQAIEEKEPGHGMRKEESSGA